MEKKVLLRIENFFPEDIRAMIMDFDSFSNLKGKISLDGIQLFSVRDFIKVFKVFVEGVVDTLNADQVSLISHSNKEGKIVFSQRLDHVKKSGSETTTYSDTAMVTLQINKRIRLQNSIPVFFLS